MTDTNDKFRALILSALMVLSVTAGTVALTGSAAAAPIEDTDATNSLVSGDVYFQGEDLYINTSDESFDGSLTIAEVTDASENETSFVSDVTLADGGNHAVIDTSNLDGTYVIMDGNNFVSFTTDGDVQSEDDQIDDASFQVAVQSLSAEFDDDDLPVSTGETATIEMSSNRGSYVVNVSAENLDEDDLADIFNQPGNQQDAVVDASIGDDDDDDSIQIQAGTDTDIEANFTDSAFDEAGSYTFDFEVNDTDATASASVDVAEEDVDLEFSQGVYTQQEGDIAAITVTMEDASDAWVFVGSDDVNYLERVHVEDDDDDGQVTILMNTRWVGTSASAGQGDGDGDNSSASDEAGIGYGLLPDSDDEMIGVTRYNGTDLPDLDRDIQSVPFDNDDPIEPADYDLVVASSADPPEADDDGELVIEDEEDVATLDLTDRSTDGISTFVAPTGNADFDPDDDEEVQELMDSLTASDTVAVGSGTGDQLVVQVNASGVGGYLFDDEGFNGQLSGSTNPPASGIYLNISEQGGANIGDNALTLEDDSATIVEGGPVPADTFLVVLDTRDYDMADGDTFDVEFQVGNEEFSDNINPYVDDEEEELVSTEVSAVDTDAEFDNVVDDQVQVSQGTNATVTGTTNAAPGEEISVRLRKTGENPFLETQTVTVNDDGTFSAQFDTSDIPVDTTFTASVREGSSTISDEEDGVIVAQQTATPTPTETETEAPTETETEQETTAGEETTMAATETEAPQDTETETGGQPGFGVAIAIVALLGAALLALRRRD